LAGLERIDRTNSPSTGPIHLKMQKMPRFSSLQIGIEFADVGGGAENVLSAATFPPDSRGFG
jgi:hypothetical protein